MNKEDFERMIKKEIELLQFRVDMMDERENEEKEIFEKKYTWKDVVEFQRCELENLLYDLQTKEGSISKEKIREKIKELDSGTFDAKIVLTKLLEEN